MTGQRESVNFDRIASRYDATRSVPAEVAARMTEAFLAEVNRVGAEIVAEVGIGTGRMSRPLMERGVRVLGFDISREMLQGLRSQLTAAHRVPDLVFGDATHLPVRGGSLRAVVVVHVLHLVSSAEEAIAEVRRILAPGGVLLHMTRATSPSGREFEGEGLGKWDEMLARRGFKRSRRLQPEDIRTMIAKQGGRLRTVEIPGWKKPVTPRLIMDDARNRTYSWTWEIPDDLYEEFLPEYERWLVERFGSPDAVFELEIEHHLDIWTWLRG